MNSKILFIMVIFTIHSAFACSIVYDTNTNYVVNGGFEQPWVDYSWHIFPSVKGWTESCNQIEIGFGQIYNTQWRSQICQLDSNHNSDISQVINLHSGHYQLVFDYANRVGQCQSTNQFSVWWNGNLLQKYSTSDYDVHHATFQVHAKCGKNVIQFRGEGQSDSYGVGIDNVGLYPQKKHNLRQSSDDERHYKVNRQGC